MTDRNHEDEEPSFSAAMDELERILKGIEDEQVDIDVLGRELERAAELLELCRAKIRRAEVEVTQIVQGLEEAGGEEEADEETGDGELEAEASGDSDGEDELPF